MKNEKYNILGLMSGTSLDGLDLALCSFSETDSRPSFKVIAAKTISYNSIWKERLQNVFEASAEQYFKLNSLFGEFIAENVNDFFIENNQTAQYIVSHGHTVFHRPKLGFTTQIGCGATIAAKTGIDTICDFRSTDVALNGQGAPLVPIGDRDLFGEHEACLNIGGIANISFIKQHKTSAFDICYANMALNFLSQQLNKDYDDGGKLAEQGVCNLDLLNQLQELNTYRQSLGREGFEQNLLPIIENSDIDVKDKLSTVVEYMTYHIASILKLENLNSVLITGGGAYNNYFINRLKENYKGKITIPDNQIIDFKEAIIFAYLGYLRVNEKTNTLSSVTNATKNSIGGCIYKGNFNNII